MTEPFLNPVGFLQEFCQKYNTAAFPQYLELGGSGPDHCKEFSCQCIFEGSKVIAKSRQKKQAKFEAALRMVKKLQEEHYFDRFTGTLSKLDRDQLSDQVTIQPLSDNASWEQTKVNTANPISSLQEFCQAKRMPLPFYLETSVSGGFVCECSTGSRKAYGHGSSKKAAKMEAAGKMCIQLKISFAGERGFNNSSQKEEESYSDKNAISSLQELCNAKKLIGKPVYEDKGVSNGVFIIECRVGTVVGVGRNTTKKGAKLLAAINVLENLITKEVITKDDLIGRSVTGVDHKPDHVLEEFDLKSDEEEDDLKPNVNEILVNGSLNETLESLTLEDSVIEVEPTTVTATVKKERHEKEENVEPEVNDTLENGTETDSFTLNDSVKVGPTTVTIKNEHHEKEENVEPEVNESLENETEADFLTLNDSVEVGPTTVTIKKDHHEKEENVEPEVNENLENGTEADSLTLNDSVEVGPTTGTIKKNHHKKEENVEPAVNENLENGTETDSLTLNDFVEVDPTTVTIKKDHHEKEENVKPEVNETLENGTEADSLTLNGSVEVGPTTVTIKNEHHEKGENVEPEVNETLENGTAADSLTINELVEVGPTTVNIKKKHRENKEKRRQDNTIYKQAAQRDISMETTISVPTGFRRLFGHRK